MMTRILLLLLVTFFLSQSYEFEIDLTRCDISACFVRESCIEGKSELFKLEPLSGLKFKDGLKDGTCDVIVQIRAFTVNKYHIMMQVNYTGSTVPIADTGVSLDHDGLQFACTKKGPIGNTNYFTTSRLGTNTYTESLVFCSFILESIDNTPIGSKFITYQDKYPMLQFSTNEAQSIEYQSEGLNFWIKPTDGPTCNPDQIATYGISDDVYLLEKINTYAFPPLLCEPGKSLSITRSTGQKIVLNEGQKLKCIKKEWAYKHPIETKIPITEKLTVDCAVKHCSLCAPLNNIEIKNGSKPTNGISDEGCVTTTCSDKPWMINDGRVLNGAMKCEKDERAVTSSWYLKTANESIKVTNASCVDTRICMKNFEPGEKCPDNPSMVCITRTMSADGSEFSCTNDFKLKWMSGGSSPAETESIKCDFTSGKFVDAKGNQLHTGSMVFCTKPGPPIEKPEAAGKAEKPPSSAGTVVGGVVGGLLLLVLVVGLIVYIVKRRREASFKAWLDQPLRKVHEADLIFMPILRSPEQDLGYKKDVVEVEQRLPWDQRPLDLPELVPSALCLGNFDNGTFDQIILKEFIQYNAENKKKVFNNIAKMAAYSENKEHNIINGTFAQFWRFFDMCVMRNMDCIDVWEMIFRLIRIFVGRLTDRKMFGTKYAGQTDTFEDRIKILMIRFAKPILNCLGWTRKATDSPADVWMRFFVVRVLMWANEVSVIVELEELADRPFEELESPMRAIVIGFANSRLGRGRELYRKYWQLVVDNPEDPAKDEYGTIRQHLMFGLTMSDKLRRGLRQMNMVLDSCFDFAAIYSPVDMYWAYSGATEQYDPAIEAIDHFVNKLPKTLSFWREDQLRDVCKTKSDSEKAAIKNEWMRASHKTLNILAESTPLHDQYDGMKKVIECTLKYYNNMPADGHEFNPIMMKERVHNIALRMWDKKREVEQEFSRALEWIEPKKEKKRFFS